MRTQTAIQRHPKCPVLNCKATLRTSADLRYHMDRVHANLKKEINLPRVHITVTERVRDCGARAFYEKQT